MDWSRPNQARRIERQGTRHLAARLTIPGDPVSAEEARRKELNRKFRELRLAGKVQQSYAVWIGEQLAKV